MARTKPPSFDFFPDDFIAGTYHLPAEAVGIYVRLLCFQWNNGSIPNDPGQLARIAGVDADAMRTHMPTIMLKFVPDECGTLKNARLERERDHKLSVIEKSKQAADTRWAKEKARKEAEAAAKLARTVNADAHADAMRTHMPPTSNVQLPTSSNTHTYIGADLLDENVVCPEWLRKQFCRWLEYSFARTGRKLDHVSQETMVFNLSKRGQEDALKDIDFSIAKQASSILDHKFDFQKARAGQIKPDRPARPTTEVPSHRKF